MMIRNLLLLALLTLLLTACGESSIAEPGHPKASAQQHPADQADDEANSPGLITASTLDQVQAKVEYRILDPWTGDLDGMLERRLIRVLTVYGLGRYYFHDRQEKGVAYESMMQFESVLNQGRKPRDRVHIVFLPVARNELIPELLAGRGDLVMAGLTITEGRQEEVDFTEPYSKPLQEILVTGPAAPPIESLEGLAGKSVPVRVSSSYYESLQRLSTELQQQGLAAIDIQPLPETLEDEDLLEMVSVGLLPWVVVDDYYVTAYGKVFPNLVARDDLVLRQGGQLAVAIRPGSPQLKKAMDDFWRSHRQGTEFGNILVQRYISNFRFIENPLETQSYKRFAELVEIFQTYGEQYGLDYLLVTAQGFQESRLDQKARSPAGAIGVMQLLPSTAADPNVGIPDITKVDANIHAGVRYLNFIRDRYFSSPEIDERNQGFFAMAAYNAGPNRIVRMQQKAASEGLDPNVWFDNVEVVVAREVGPEPVTYVANIFKYYVTYRLAAQTLLERLESRRQEGLQ